MAELPTNFYSFFQVVLIAAVIIWIFTMGLYCILMVRTKPTQVSPLAPCPDKWTLGENGVCKCNPNRDNCGSYPKNKVDMSGCDWLCKKNWAVKHNIFWDGLSNSEYTFAGPPPPPPVEEEEEEKKSDMQ